MSYCQQVPNRRQLSHRLGLSYGLQVPYWIVLPDRLCLSHWPRMH
jgi:hypothetical protein